MPRRLLRDRVIVEDDWLYAAESPDVWPPPGRPPGGRPPRGRPPRVILSWDQWSAQRDAWLAHAPTVDAAAIGVVLSPEHKVEQLAPDLEHFSLVACRFPGPSEGRGYSQGRLLRERYAFQGELRASGYVRIDQLFFLARCGFNSFELPDHELSGAAAATAAAAFSTFTAAYQPTNDRGLPMKLDRPASGESARRPVGPR